MNYSRVLLAGASLPIFGWVARERLAVTHLDQPSAGGSLDYGTKGIRLPHRRWNRYTNAPIELEIESRLGLTPKDQSQLKSIL